MKEFNMKKMNLVFWGGFILSFGTVCHAQQLFRWVDKNGLVHFSDQAPMPATTKDPHIFKPRYSQACLKAKNKLELFKEGLWVNPHPSTQTGPLNDEQRQQAMNEIQHNIQTHCPLAKTHK